MPIVKKVRKLGGRPAFGAAARETSPLRPEFVDKAAPCLLGCPNGTDVRAVLTTLALAEAHGLSDDRAAEAAFYLLADRNPLPATCGRLCPHHCEDDCNRAGHDEALAVNAIERAIGEAAIAMGLPLIPIHSERRPERVAVIGAGPAGLSAAYQLARLGYAVTVFDQRPRPGGELVTAVDDGRLPRHVLEAEVARVAALGVEFACGAAPGERGGPAAGTSLEIGQGFARVIRTKIPSAREPQAGSSGEPGFGPAFVPAALPASIHFGRHAAQVADAGIRGVSIERRVTPPRATRDRIRFDHHGHLARPAAADRALTIAEAIGEARRCLACGGCLECDNCWKYCPDQAVVKPLERGQPYRFRLEFCQGCSKCAEECPTGYIDMR